MNKINYKVLFINTRGIYINEPTTLIFQNCRIICCNFSNKASESSYRGIFLFYNFGQEYSVYLPIQYSTTNTYIRIDVKQNTFRILDCGVDDISIFSIIGLL